jgi:hypothetical protein
MSKTVSLIYNTILGGKWYTAGEPIERGLVPANLQKYIAKPSSQVEPQTERHLNFNLNQAYSVDEDGYLRGSPARQAAEMEAEASAEDLIADELAEAEDSPEVVAAIEEAGEGYRADLEGAKLQAKIRAERAEAAAYSLRQEQDERVESGEFDQWNAEALRQPPQEAAPRRPANSKLKVKGKRSFVRRGKRFLLATMSRI